jgi:hypothetical protein
MCTCDVHQSSLPALGDRCNLNCDVTYSGQQLLWICCWHLWMANPMNLDGVWFRNDTANINGMRSRGEWLQDIQFSILFGSTVRYVYRTTINAGFALAWDPIQGTWLCPSEPDKFIGFRICTGLGLEYAQVNQTNLNDSDYVVNRWRLKIIEPNTS